MIALSFNLSPPATGLFVWFALLAISATYFLWHVLKSTNKSITIGEFAHILLGIFVGFFQKYPDHERP